MTAPQYWSAHVHSRKSRNDAMSPVKELVTQGVELGYPVIALTDHGTVGGTVELYQACQKAGVLPAPGVELYLTPDAAAGDRKSMHLTVLSRTAQGYRNLVNLNNLAHRHFFQKPRVDLATLAGLAEDGGLQGLLCATGCRSGPVVKALTERGPEAAKQVVEALAGWFPRTYVEIMDHGFTADGMWDAAICEALIAIADEVGLPYLITTDTHYTYPDDRAHHEALKELIGFSEDPADRLFNGEGYWLQDLEHLKTVYEPQVLARSLDALAEIAESMAVAIPELDDFTLKIPNFTGAPDPMAELAEQTSFKLRKLAAEQQWKPARLTAHEQRMAEELEVVRTSGMALYLLMVIAITDECAKRRIWFHTRGSATGSIILWLNRTTQENPIDHDIRFDRFLSADRTSPPDVDLDIEHTRRVEIFDWLKESYVVLAVGTTTTYSLAGDRDDNGTLKGSLRVKYFQVANKGKEKTDPDYVHSWEQVPFEERQVLTELSERNLVSGRGTHPGGTIIAPDPASVAALPMERIGDKDSDVDDVRFVTAYDKDDVEAMGFPKVDVLGSKVLTALHLCCDLIVDGDGRDYYEQLDRKDAAAIKRIGSGATVGLFQLSGWTQRRGFEDMKPKNLQEVFDGQAIFRPAPMESGFTEEYLKRRADKSIVIPTQHADIMAETKTTYGLAIYQEQLVGAMRRLGMSSAQLTKMLKAVKASGKAGEAKAKQAVAEELESIKALAVTRGWDDSDIEWLASTLTDYGAGYSFGKAHSVQYGVVAYKTAWLAEHEPLAFWTGMLLAYKGSKRKVRGGTEDMEVVYATAARKDGVRVVPPHVNRSGVNYAPDPDAFAIRKGLSSVAMVSDAAAAELVAKAPYTSLVDLAQRVSSAVTCASKLLYGADPLECGGMVTPLFEAGAFEGIPPGEPMRRAKGRIRRCKECKHTFASALEYEDHVDAGHVLPEIEENA